MTASFFRLFCQTDGHSPTSELAWAFMRRMIRIRPVLVASLSGPQMGGRWIGYESLRITPQLGSFVNVVCTDPERWTWLSRVPAPTTQLSPLELAAGDDSTVEMISARQELWTAGVRNVLIAPAAPRTEHELRTALKYDVVITTKLGLHMDTGMGNHLVEHPYPEDTVRNLILGADA